MGRRSKCRFESEWEIDRSCVQEGESIQIFESSSWGWWWSSFLLSWICGWPRPSSTLQRFIQVYTSPLFQALDLRLTLSLHLSLPHFDSNLSLVSSSVKFMLWILSFLNQTEATHFWIRQSFWIPNFLPSDFLGRYRASTGGFFDLPFFFFCLGTSDVYSPVYYISTVYIFHPCFFSLSYIHTVHTFITLPVSLHRFQLAGCLLQLARTTSAFLALAVKWPSFCQPSDLKQLQAKHRFRRTPASKPPLHRTSTYRTRSGGGRKTLVCFG